MTRGLADVTAKNYKVGQSHYLRFGAANNLATQQLFPPSAATVLAFTAYLFMLPSFLSYNTTKSYLCHAKSVVTMLGHDGKSFACPRLAHALRTIKRERGSKVRAKRIPITVSLLATFLPFLDPSSTKHSALAAVLCVGVYGLFRSGELVPKDDSGATLLRRHILWDVDKVTIHLDHSKTDPFRVGIDVVIYANSTDTCPFAAFFRHWEAAPKQHPNAPVFQNDDGSAFTYTQLNNSIKNLATVAGLDHTRFSGHSLRIGGATSLAILGYPAHIIQTLGRWKSLSYQLYTRMSESTRKLVAQKLGSVARAKERNFFGGMALNDAYSLSLDTIEAVWKTK